MPVRSLVLIPPSEGKAPGGSGAPWRPGTTAFAELDGARREVLAALAAAGAEVGGPTMPAVERYTGVLYRELDAGSLRAPARRRLHRDVLIASGLWGLLAPADPIPDHRLAMGARVEPLGRLATWWRPRLTEALAPRVRGAVVWDLLPNEYAAAVDWRALDPRVRVTVRFLDASGRVVSHWNKLLKGSLVRWLAETGASDPERVEELRHPQGYRLDRASSTFDGDRVELVLRAGHAR